MLKLPGSIFYYVGVAMKTLNLNLDPLLSNQANTIKVSLHHWSIFGTIFTFEDARYFAFFYKVWRFFACSLREFSQPLAYQRSEMFRSQYMIPKITALSPKFLPQIVNHVTKCSISKQISLNLEGNPVYKIHLIPIVNRTRGTPWARNSLRSAKQSLRSVLKCSNL